MTYATVEDVEKRMNRTLTTDEEALCETLLEDAAVIIDVFNAEASADAKKIVSCNMVIRRLGSGEDSNIPVGATQGSMSGLGFSQSWTVGSGGSVGDMYLTKMDKKLLGVGNKIISYSPVQELVPEVTQ